MPRPKNKEELLNLSANNFEKLLSYISELSPAQQKQSFKPGTLNRNITDVLAHLHHWHLMLATWYKVGMAGEKPAMPAPGYTWKTLPLLNKAIWEEHQNDDFNEAREALKASYREVRQLITKHGQTELFEKKYYPWTGSTSLGAYFISATSSHYDWALKLIKKGLK